MSVAQPANDRFSDARSIVGTNGATVDSSVGASKEPGEPNHAANAGGRSIWYRWESPMTGVATFDTIGSSFDTLLAAYTGSAVNALTLRAGNDDVVLGGQSRISFRIDAGTTYYVAVDGYNGVSGNVTLNWSSQPPPANDNFTSPLDLTGPGGYVIGTSAGARKEAGEPNHAGEPGGASVWFRWSCPVSGPVSFNTFSSGIADTVLGVYTGSSVDSLTLVATNDNANPANPIRWSRVVFNATAGQQYRIALDGSNGAFGPYQLTWGAGVPLNNDFANATAVFGVFNVTTGSTVLATKQPGEPAVGSGGGIGGASIWYKWRPDINGPASVNTYGSSFDTLLGVYTGNDVANLMLVGANDNAFTRTLQSRVAFNAVAGSQYFIAVDGYFSMEGIVRLNWVAGTPSNDSFAAALALNGPTGVWNGFNDFATKESGEPNHAGRPGTNSVWHRWSPPASGVATISLVGSLFDTLLAVYTGTAVGSLTEVASNDNFAGTLQSQVHFIAQQGTTYRIAVDGPGGIQGPYTLTYTLNPPPTLQIRREGNQIVVQWAGPYRLESASVLAKPVAATVWTPVAGASPLTLPLESAHQFFRAVYP